MAITSRRTHAIARSKASKLWVTSPAGRRLTYLQFAGEITRGVIADCLQLQVILCEIAGSFACDCSGIFACVHSYFECVRRVFLAAILVLLRANCMYFCLQKQANLHASRGQICMSSTCKIVCQIPAMVK